MSVFIFIFILFFLSLSLSWTFFSLVFWAVFSLPFRTDATQLVALVVRILRVLVESPPPAHTHTHTHVQQIRQLSLNGDAWKDFSLWALNFFSISLLFCVHERLTVCIFDVCKRTKCENARAGIFFSLFPCWSFHERHMVMWATTHTQMLMLEDESEVYAVLYF